MKVSDLMTKNVVTAELDTRVSQLLGKMKEHGIHQIPIIKGGELAGMAELQSIITKDIDPRSTKAHAVMKKTVSVAPGMDANEAVAKLLSSGFRALPVTDDGEVVGIISDTDLLKLVSSSNESVEGALKKCEYVSPNDDVGKIENIMFLKKVSRVPVVEKGAIIGVVGTLDMIDIYLRAKEKFEARGSRLSESGAREKMPVAKISARAVMKQPTMIRKNEKISAVAELLQKNEHVVSSDVGNFYIVTPKDVLRATQKKPETAVGVQITHLNEDAITNEEVNERFLNFAAKVAKLDPKAENVNVFVEKHNEGRGKIKYSIKATLKTPKGLFIGHKWGWSIMEAVEQATEAMEREMESKYGKDRAKGRKTARMKKE